MLKCLDRQMPWGHQFGEFILAEMVKQKQDRQRDVIGDTGWLFDIQGGVQGREAKVQYVMGCYGCFSAKH